jgi:hypothetical protein
LQRPPQRARRAGPGKKEGKHEGGKESAQGFIPPTPLLSPPPAPPPPLPPCLACHSARRCK